ncbi:MAG: hypothetical protein QS748_09740 [Candidatus Endonucleobacter bathymodioli]|uniref:Outer membrane lipoprotein BamD-like domain-containing protein n=1 Tax=Candidatus Endonucleibacter bathymodioli TaxID=539814 RepID=A0AA90NMQ6_9GAMM|nr:hypothetical protein [Candidatus Endonucleobacter bathymodioli]
MGLKSLTLIMVFMACTQMGCMSTQEKQVPSNSDAVAKHSEYFREEEQFKAALAHDTLSSYQDFIASNPRGLWIKNAIYYRDRAAFMGAKKQDTKEAYQNFLNKYPDSDWTEQAEYFLKQSNK